MFKDPGTRRAVAIVGIALGGIFTAGVLWSVLSGQSEWWSIFLLLPVLLIVYRLYSRWIRRA